jgi:hypothetical protein
MLFSKPSPPGTTSPSSCNCGSWISAKSSLPVDTGARCSATRCCWGHPHGRHGSGAATPVSLAK